MKYIPYGTRVISLLVALYFVYTQNDLYFYVAVSCYVLSVIACRFVKLPPTEYQEWDGYDDPIN